MELKLKDITIQVPDHMLDDLYWQLRKRMIHLDLLERPNYLSNVDPYVLYLANHAEQIAEMAVNYEKDDSGLFEELIYSAANMVMADERKAWEQKQGKWICSDPDCHQYCRLRDGWWEFYQMLSLPDIDGKELFEVVYNKFELPAENIMESSEFAHQYLRCFGYQDLDDVKQKCGIDWPRIVAECMFETDSIACPSALGSEEYCKGFIDAMVKEDER